MFRKFGWWMIILFLSGCTTIYNPATGKRETLLINTQEEIYLGQDLDRQIRAQMKLLADPDMQRRLNSIGEKVAKVSDRQDLQYHFNIVDEKEFNAFAIPGGNVYVNSGLILAANNDELAAVIGHEVGHIAARHSAKRLQANLGYQLVASMALGAGGQDQLIQAMDVVFNVITLGYSRQDEYLADSLGVKYSYAAGYNPQGMVSFFQKLKSQGSQQSFNLVFLSSHPPVEERIKKAQEQIAALPQK